MKTPTSIEKWKERARLLMAQCPENVMLYAANGNLHVIYIPNGEQKMTASGGVDPDYVVGTIAGRGMRGPRVDGGDW